MTNSQSSVATRPEAILVSPPTNLTESQIAALATAEDRRHEAAAEAVRLEGIVAANAAMKEIEKVGSDLRNNGCSRAAAALNTLAVAMEVESVEDVAGSLRDLGVVHANRSRLRPETLTHTEAKAEQAAGFLLGIFCEFLEEARGLFRDASQARRQGRKLHGDGLHTEAMRLISRARGIAFGNKNEDLPSAFGGAGFAALDRMVESGKELPEAISRRLTDDRDFAERLLNEADGKRGAALLSALLAPPPRRETAPAPARQSLVGTLPPKEDKAKRLEAERVAAQKRAAEHRARTEGGGGSKKGKRSK